MADKHEPCELIIKMTQEIFGNGGPGLLQEFKAMRDEFLQWKGSFRTLLWLLGFIGASQIFAIILYFIGKK
jgi:hypothetical protein